MFRRPFKVKSNTQMKGSDKKKLKLELLRNFPVLTVENLKAIVPTKDDLFLVKVLTYIGESVHFYCNEKLPILFTRANRLYPTLYLLWELPSIVPLFTTAPEVLPVLQGGADFMVAGILTQNLERRFGKVSKGDVVYINLTDNKAAVAVGECALSSHDMYMSGGRGKCVIVLHTYEDELCKFGTFIPLPQLEPAFARPAPSQEPLPVSVPSEKPSYAGRLRGDEPVPASVIAEVPPIKNLTIVESPVAENGAKDKDDDDDDDDLSSADDVVTFCFLKALNTTVRNVKLPLLISNFYKLHMIPACPEGKEIDIKKSRFKKMSKLIQEMKDEKVIEIEEPSPGVQSIVNINYSHHLLSGFLDGRRAPNAKEDKQDEPQVIEKYSVTAAVLPIFSEFLIKKGESMTASEARKYASAYIRKYGLPLTEDNSLVRLDDTLKNIVAQGANADVPEVVKWAEVIDRVLYKMSRTFKITTKSNAVFTQKEQKGKLPHIDIRIANKSGNKKVTLINNLEAYGINMEEFSRECQRGVAASATINNVTGLKSLQLQIQGNQINFLEKILTGKYNIPKKYINGLQFAPKKK